MFVWMWVEKIPINYLLNQCFNNHHLLAIMAGYPIFFSVWNEKKHSPLMTIETTKTVRENAKFLALTASVIIWKKKCVMQKFVNWGQLALIILK